MAVYHKEYLSEDGTMYVRQTKRSLHTPSTQPPYLYDNIEIVQKKNDKVICTIYELSYYVDDVHQVPVLGWHGQYIVLLMMPTRFDHPFNIHQAYIAVISVEQKKIIHREYLFYSNFRLQWNEDKHTVQIFSKSEESDRITGVIMQTQGVVRQTQAFIQPTDGLTLQSKEKATCYSFYAIAEKNSVEITFGTTRCTIRGVYSLNAPELASWSPDFRQCCFYASYGGRDVLAVVRKTDEQEVILDAWHLGHRPDHVEWKDGTCVPTIWGMEAHKRPFQWDDSDYQKIPLYPIQATEIPVKERRTKSPTSNRSNINLLKDMALTEEEIASSRKYAQIGVAVFLLILGLLLGLLIWLLI